MVGSAPVQQLIVALLYSIHKKNYSAYKKLQWTQKYLQCTQQQQSTKNTKITTKKPIHTKITKKTILQRTTKILQFTQKNYKNYTISTYHKFFYDITN